MPRGSSEPFGLAVRGTVVPRLARLLDVDQDQVAAVLRETSFFRGVDASDLGSVAEIADEEWSPPGQHIFFYGDIATEFFVLARGKVRIYIPGHGDELDLGIVRDGQMFGEGGLLDGGPRVASAIALEPSTLLRIPRDQWLLVIDELPEFTRRMFAAVGASVRRYTSHAIDFLFLDVEIPSFPPEEDVSRG